MHFDAQFAVKIAVRKALGKSERFPLLELPHKAVIYPRHQDLKSGHKLIHKRPHLTRFSPFDHPAKI